MSDCDFDGCSRTYATLCIYHNDLRPEDITEILGFSPHDQVIKNQKITKSRSAKRNGWFYSTNEKSNSMDVMVHIRLLLNALLGKENNISKLKDRGCEITINCFWGSLYGNGGPFLSHDIIMALARMPIDLSFDVWFEEES